MITVKRSIHIKAPVERVFEYVTDPSHLPEFWPSMVEVSNVTRSTDGGYAFDWTYKMAGLRLRGHSGSVELERNRRVVSRSTGAIPATLRWDYEARGDEMTMTLQVDYQVPGGVIERLAEPVIRRINEREAETLLENLKTLMEQGRSP